MSKSKQKELKQTPVQATMALKGEECTSTKLSREHFKIRLKNNVGPDNGVRYQDILCNKAIPISVPGQSWKITWLCHG